MSTPEPTIDRAWLRVALRKLEDEYVFECFMRRLNGFQTRNWLHLPHAFCRKRASGSPVILLKDSLRRSKLSTLGPVVAITSLVSSGIRRTTRIYLRVRRPLQRSVPAFLGDASRRPAKAIWLQSATLLISYSPY